jgi:hypothetical protein
VPVFDLIGIVLGALSIVWGFLDWYGSSGGSFIYKGFATTGAGAIGLSVLAAAAAALALIDRQSSSSTVPTAAAVAALLVTAGLLIGKPSGEQAKIGLILQLITAVLQTVLFALGWVQARGKITQAPDMPSQGAPWPAPSPYSYQARAAADLPSQPLPYVPPYPAAGPYPPRQPYPSYPPQGYPSPAPHPAPHQEPRQQQGRGGPTYPRQPDRPGPFAPGPQEPHAPYPPSSGEPGQPNSGHYRT